MATESSLVDVAPKWSNPATNNEWPSGGGCCCCCSGLRLLAPFAVGSQAALPFPDLPFVCSFTFFIVSAVSLVVVVVVVGLTALCLVDFSCVCVCAATGGEATPAPAPAPTAMPLESFKQNVAKVFNILYGVSGFL